MIRKYFFHSVDRFMVLMVSLEANRFHHVCFPLLARAPGAAPKVMKTHACFV